MNIFECEQGSPEWFDHRLGVVTASKAKSILTPKTQKLSASVDGYAMTLAAELLTRETCDEAAGGWAERGTALEPEARDYYILTEDVDVQTVGFVTREGGRVGCSPDGMVGVDGLLEIKCRTAKNHVAVLLGAPLTVYLPQVHFQMWVCERAWCDLLLFNPRMPSKVVRIERDEEYIDKLASAVGELVAKIDGMVERVRAMEVQHANPFV